MPQRKAIGKKARFEVFKRDSFACQYCGAEAPGVVLHVDHIHPVSKGGDNSITNLVTACESCNAGKGDRELSDESAVKKQKRQLDEINQRREQIKMIAQWRREIADTLDMEVDVAEEHWSEVTSGYVLSESGRKIVRSQVRRYGLQQVINAMEYSCDRHLIYDKHGEPCEQSVHRAFNGIASAAKYSSLPAHAQKIRYINGIARNNCDLDWDEQRSLKKALEEIYEAGGCLDEAQDFCKQCGHSDDLWDYIDGRLGDLRHNEEIA